MSHAQILITPPAPYKATQPDRLRSKPDACPNLHTLCFTKLEKAGIITPTAEVATNNRTHKYMDLLPTLGDLSLLAQKLRW